MTTHILTIDYRIFNKVLKTETKERCCAMYYCYLREKIGKIENNIQMIEEKTSNLIYTVRSMVQDNTLNDNIQDLLLKINMQTDIANATKNEIDNLIGIDDSTLKITLVQIELILKNNTALLNGLKEKLLLHKEAIKQEKYTSLISDINNLTKKIEEERREKS